MPRFKKAKRLFWRSLPVCLERFPPYERWVKPKPGELLCVNYHGTLERDRSNFERQIEWFAENFNCLSERDLHSLNEGLKRSGKPSIVITFDDGYRSNFDVAIPILKDFGIRAIFFLIAGAYGGSCFDGEALWSKPIASDYLLTEHQVFEMLKDGHSIGCHTKSHAHLGKLPAGALGSEIVFSREILQQTFGVDVRSFALPFGTSDSFSKDAAKLINETYSFFFHSFPSRSSNGQRGLVGRYCLEPSFSVSELRLRLSGACNWRHWKARSDLIKYLQCD